MFDASRRAVRYIVATDLRRGDTRRPIFPSTRRRQSVKKEEGVKADGQSDEVGRRRDGRSGDGRIGRKARFVDFELPCFFPRPFPFVVAFSCGCRHYGSSLRRAALSLACPPSPSLIPIDCETRNGDSLNLDPRFDGTLAR